MASGIDDLVDFTQRLDALDKLMHGKISAELVILGERTHNISASLPSGIEVNPALFSEPEENEIWSLYQQSHEQIRSLIDQRKYVEASELYTHTFSAPVHNFFERVFVNVDDEKVRYNRMALVKAINLLYSERVANLAKIVPPQS
jgi:glycyl-tRNA synthetase beta chain